LKNELFLRHAAIHNSLNFVIYSGLYAILNKMNLFSLFYWVCLYRILKKNPKPNIFKAESRDRERQGSAAQYNSKAQYGSPKNKSILLMVQVQLVLISAVIVLQLAFSIYTNVSLGQQEEMQRGIYNVFCPNPHSALDEEDAYDEEGNVYQTPTPVANGEINKECA
jgi:hypothetical protein